MLSEFGDFSAPLGVLKAARLVFTSTASQVVLQVCNGDELYQASFQQDIPSVWLREGSLMIQTSRLPLHVESVPAELSTHKPLAEIRLNGAIPWELEFRDGVSDLKADLRGLQLQSMDILGDACRIEFFLSKPEPAESTAYIYISGGVNKATFSRPNGVGARVHIQGSAYDFVLDDQILGAISTETYLESPDFVDGSGGYDFCIAGGVSQVKIR